MQSRETLENYTQRATQKEISKRDFSKKIGIDLCSFHIKLTESHCYKYIGLKDQRQQLLRESARRRSSWKPSETVLFSLNNGFIFEQLQQEFPYSPTIIYVGSKKCKPLALNPESSPSIAFVSNVMLKPITVLSDGYSRPTWYLWNRMN